jgi:hypothetical protein
MVQPKYSPEEALEKIKLMMKYDTSKTLNENTESTKEPINEVIPLIWGAITAAPWLYGIGTAAVAGISTWIYNTQGGGDAFTKAQTFFAGCSSLDAKLKPTQNKSDHREAADSIYNAIEGIGTDEDAIKGAISSMESVADICAMYKYYNKTYGDLYEDLDGDLDGESFRRYVWSAIAPIVDDAEENLEQAKKEENPKKDEKKRDNSKTAGYKLCSGTYSFGCKTSPSGPIGVVQGCLGLTTDGKFGPKTKTALSGKGFTTFTDKDVDKICSTVKPQEKPQDEFSVQVDGERIDDILNM